MPAQVVFKVFHTAPPPWTKDAPRARLSAVPGNAYLVCSLCGKGTGKVCPHVWHVLSALAKGNLPKYTKVYPETLQYKTVAASPKLTQIVKNLLAGKPEVQAAPAPAKTPAPTLLPEPALIPPATEAPSGILKGKGLWIDLSPEEMKVLAARKAAAKAAKAAAEAAAVEAAKQAPTPSPTPSQKDPALVAAEKFGFAIDLD